MDAKTLNEIATNRRMITSDLFGTFQIIRPTYSVEAQIESARARQINADLQERTAIEDPITGLAKEVPAFLSRRSKADQLRFHGLWSDEHEQRLEEVAETYRDTALALEGASFESADTLVAGITGIREQLAKNFKSKNLSLEEELLILCPSLDSVFDGTEPVARVEAYKAARQAVGAAAGSPVVDELLDELDKYQRQLELFRDGVKAQTELFALRINELSLFADTMEARADKAGQLAKVYCCTLDAHTGKCPWKTQAELARQSPKLVPWLLMEIEKFERLEGTDAPSADENKRADRFNFLAALGVFPSASSASSPEEQPSSPDGDSPDTDSESSTEV
jgi:hypothetical protein